MKFICRFFVLLLAVCSVASARPKPKPAPEQGYWLFAYFIEPAKQGIYLAISRDGLHYTPLNDGQPWVKPAEQNELMRDVYITRGPDKLFHMVWTWGWHVPTLGYANSPDLQHWSAQKQIPIMQDYPDTNNVWAPEIYYDAAKGKWLVLWSSASKTTKGEHRIWSSFTADFNTFTKPQIYFDPGYAVIDQTIFHAEGEPYRFIFKQQSTDPLTYWERVATGPTLEGPWNNFSDPINENWSEGPSAIKLGDRYVIFYDHYRGDHIRYEAVASRDWQHWEDITAETDLPAHCKHGSFLHISDAEAKALLARHDPAEPAATTMPTK